jgi:hypothetical protein
MKERKAVTRETTRRYCRANRGTRTAILNEFVKVTELNRKYAIQLLRGTLRCGASLPRAARPRGRPRVYDQSMLAMLKRLWALFGFMCGKRLAPAIRVNLVVLEKFKELRGLTQRTRAQLLKVSPASIDRLLAVERKKLRLKGRSHTRPGSMRKTLIPLRTFGSEEQKLPGYVEVDLVGHDGGSSSGEFAQTLTLTDVATGWTEVRAVRNKAQKWVFPALQHLASFLPFPLKGLNADNGGEFINYNLYNWCQMNHLAFTRSRAYRKNDNPYVEQKNNAVVRTAVGYYRYDTQEQLRLLNQLYAQLRLLVNFFYPSMKLVEKIRVGARVKKRYDTPTTPYQRVLDCAHIEEQAKEKLRQQFAQLNLAAITRSLCSLQGELERKAALRQRVLDDQRRMGMVAAG